LLAFAGNPSVASANPKVPNTAEFRGGVYEGVVSVPLMDNGRALGVANFCRAEKDPWKSRDVAFLLNLGVPLGALLTTSHLRAELQKTAQQLADRKLLERAKGLLQERLGYSEEEAYLQVRRLSRQRRRPMREIARQIIEADVQAFPAVRVQNAD
jgi:uroporphyrinogen-III synthase